jgi:hypothetical protein
LADPGYPGHGMSCPRFYSEARVEEEGDMTENDKTANEEIRVIYAEVSRWLVLGLSGSRG